MVMRSWWSVSMAATLWVAAAAPATQAGWVIEWENTPFRKDARQDSQMATAYIQANKTRMEQEHLTTVYDYDKGKFTILNPKSKFFWSGDVEDYVKLSAKRRDEALRKRAGSGVNDKDVELPQVDPDSLPEITVERSGETRTIAGHDTVKHVVRVNDEVFQELWIAEGLSTASDLDPDKLIKYQQISSRGMIGASSAPYNALYRSPEYRKLLDKGVALETMTHHLAGGFEQRARSIRQADVDAAKFSVPEDYRRVRLDDVFQVEQE
jgi:hypothetical protein